MLVDGGRVFLAGAQALGVLAVEKGILGGGEHSCGAVKGVGEWGCEG